MHSAKLTFSDGSTLVIHDGQAITPILELLFRYKYFRLEDNDNKVYNSSAVFTIENM